MSRDPNYLNNYSFDSPLIKTMSDPQPGSSTTEWCQNCQKTPWDLNGQPMQRCSRCKTSYCSIDCQRQNWKAHKPLCHDPSLPIVLIISVGGFASPIESSASHLLTGLRRCANIVVAAEAADAKRLAKSEFNFHAVILVDGALMEMKKFTSLRKKVVAYVKAGGTVVLGATFAAYNRSGFFNECIRDEFGLLWVSGSYQRAVVHLNKDVEDKKFKGNTMLAASYSQKAVWLKGVPVGDRVYIPDERSRTQSMVFSSEVVDQTQSPVCWAKVEKGWLGYVGDVNCEEESTAVTLAMCNVG